MTILDFGTAQTIAAWIKKYTELAGDLDPYNSDDARLLGKLDSLGQPMIAFLAQSGWVIGANGLTATSTNFGSKLE